MDQFLIVLSGVIFVVGAGTVLLLFTMSSRGPTPSSDHDCDFATRPIQSETFVSGNQRSCSETLSMS
jgi:hypothetical protein